MLPLPQPGQGALITVLPGKRARQGIEGRKEGWMPTQEHTGWNCQASSSLALGNSSLCLPFTPLFPHCLGLCLKEQLCIEL